jgi:hypothetical protein
MEQQMSRILHFCLAVCFGLVSCAPSFKGIFEGAGQIGNDRFFSFTLDTERRTVTWQESHQGQEVLALCDIVQNKGAVSFSIDLDSRAKTCEEMKNPYRFQGTLGRDVVTGEVSDLNGRVVGRFRALRHHE